MIWKNFVFPGLAIFRFTKMTLVLLCLPIHRVWLSFIDIVDLESFSFVSKFTQNITFKLLHGVVSKRDSYSDLQLVILVRLLVRYDPNMLSIGDLGFLIDKIWNVSESCEHQIRCILNRSRKVILLKAICKPSNIKFVTKWADFERLHSSQAQMALDRLSLEQWAFCDARDNDNHWYASQILYIDEDGRLLVHFIGLGHENDDWVQSHEINSRILTRGSGKPSCLGCQCATCCLILVIEC
jgi:hypothetical protein